MHAEADNHYYKLKYKEKTVRIHYLGHAAAAVEHDSHCVLIDPFLQGHELPESLKPETIFLTHGHSDHTGDAEIISKKFGANITAVFELASYFGEKGCRCTPCGIGGKIEHPWGWSRFVPARHTSSLDGKYMGEAAGIVFNIGGITLYHAGDTGIFGDMALIAELYKPEVAFLPIGGLFTMDTFEALKAIKLINPEIVIPIHYNTFPGIAADANKFKEDAERETSAKVWIMEPRTSKEYDSCH